MASPEGKPRATGRRHRGSRSGKPRAAFGKPPAASDKPRAAFGKPRAAFGKPPAASDKSQAAFGKPPAASDKPRAAFGKPPAASDKSQAAASGLAFGKPPAAFGKSPAAFVKQAVKPFFSEAALAFIAKYNKICNAEEEVAPAQPIADITKEFMGLLNKLTDKNYDKIFAKIKQSISGGGGEAPIEFIAKEIYNKSLFDTNYHLQYATLAKDIWVLTGTKAQMMDIFYQYFATRHEYMGKDSPDNEYSTNFCIKRHYLTIMQLYGAFYRIGEIDDEFAVKLIGEMFADAKANAEEIDMLSAFVVAIGEYASERLTEYIASVVRTIKAPSKRHEYILMNMTAAVAPSSAVVLRDEADVSDFLSKSTFEPFIIEDQALYDELYGQLFMRLLGKEQERLLPLLNVLVANGFITDEQLAQQITLIEDNMEDIILDEPGAPRYLAQLEAKLGFSKAKLAFGKAKLPH